MHIPAPEPGLVVRFNYLWRREQLAGRDNARYARPCAIVLTQRRDIDGALLVLVAPITHSPPIQEDSAIPLPEGVKASLGLDSQPSWIVVDEVNEFAWPGFDLEPNAAGEIAYGFIPPKLYEQLKSMILKRAQGGRLRRVPR
jgi:hypothetical protein